MTFRSRLLAAFLVVVIAPLLVLSVMIPREMKKRFTAQYAERVATTAARIRKDLADEHKLTKVRLDTVMRGLREENGVRRVLINDPADRGDLLDYSEGALLRTGLKILQVQNDSGRILSSGHFRNEYDRIDSTFPAALRVIPEGYAVVKMRTAGAPILALARTDTTRVGARLFTVIAGVTIDSAYLARSQGPGVGIALVVDDGALVRTTENSISVSAGATDSISLPYVDATGDNAKTGIARLYIAHSTAELDAAVRDVRTWIVGTILVAVVAALAVALWLASWLSSPISQLASESAHVDLDNPRAQFSSAKREDEIGTLARRLGSMIDRMRASATRLSDAERRATVGEVARQVNHDIKNGLTPIRNVVRHLAHVADDTPSELPALFKERQQTLESSIEYLDTLARNYARLSPRFDVAPCDVRPVIEEVVRGAGTRGSTVKSVFAPDVKRVLADAAVLRRILENLVGNAIDALDGKPGEVVVSAAPAGAEREQPMLRIVVSDSGRGMTPQQLQKAFDDFYTTKTGGTGLGLSVVRRLVADLSGILRVETTPGQGTRVIVDIPSDGTEPTRAAGTPSPVGGKSR